MPNASILTQITSATALNTTTIYQPTTDCSGYITTLKATVNIKSIAPSNFPYIPDSTPAEAVEAILTELSEALEYKEITLLLKKVSGSWIEKNKIRLFNKDPYYEIDLMAYLTDANTVDVAEDLAIALRMNQPLDTGDYITIFGFAVEEKKTDDLEAIKADVESLKLALYGLSTPSWQNLTFQGGWTPTLQGTPPPGVRKFGKVATLRGLFTVGASSADGTMIATIPEGYRPKFAFDAPIVQWLSTGYAFGAMYVLPTGEILVYSLSGGISNVSIPEISYEI